MRIFLKGLLLAAVLLLLPVLAAAQTKLPLSNKNFNTHVLDKGWSHYDSLSNIKDIVVVQIGKDSTMIGYMNFLEGFYSVTYKTDIKVADNGFSIMVSEKGKQPYLFATGFLESNRLMVLTLSQNPVPEINSMFNKSLTLRLEEVKDPEAKKAD